MPAVRPSFPAVRAVLALALIGALASLLALSAPSPLRAAEHDVRIADDAFSPATLTIAVGDTVTWRNADDRPHTVTSTDGAFDSGNLDEGVGFSFTFMEPGTYTYVCEYHSDMRATIVVDAASAPAAGESTSRGTDGPATDADGATAPAPHAPATHEAGQPDTAVELPVALAWLAPLLIGLGLVALAFGLLPPGRQARSVEGAPGGWRR